MNARSFIFSVACAAAGIGIVVGPRYCARPSAPVETAPDFVQAVETLKAVTRARSVRRSTFAAFSAPDLAPSDWVAWFYSIHGAGAWPIVEGSVEDDPAIRLPKLPPTVAVVREAPNPERGRQVVLAADDARWELVAWTFPDPARPPTSEVRWAFPRIDAKRP